MDNGGDYTRQSPYLWSGVPHYYGDIVRQLLISAAALVLLGAPFYAEDLRAELPFEIMGAIVFVALGALLNPHSKLAIFANVIAAGVGSVVYETWALYQYEDSTWTQFILREVIAIILLVAFYFSMKTARAFLLHKVGKRDEAGEFDEERMEYDPPAVRGAKSVSGNDDFNPWASRNHSPKGKAKSEESESSRMSPGRSREEIEPKSHPYEERL